MNYRRVFDGQRMRFVDPAQHTIASCGCPAPAGIRVGIPEPHTVDVYVRAPAPRQIEPELATEAS